MLTFQDIKKHPKVLEFINQSEIALKALDYTEHGLRHAKLVAREAKNLAKQINLSERGQDLAAIAGFCHDMGNFLGRSQHHYWGALLFHQIFSAKGGSASGGKDDFTPKELVWIIQAISNHDKNTMKLTEPISAIVVLADKSDVHRSRVTVKSLEKIKIDIHDRVNYAVTKSDLSVNKAKKQIILTLKIDRKFVPVIEFFEIFTERMTYCRQAANYLGYKFHLVINNFKLL